MTKGVLLALIGLCLLAGCVSSEAPPLNPVSCDALHPCERGDCYVFPDASTPVCFEGNPCVRCPTGNCTIAESYPMQVFCEGPVEHVQENPPTTVNVKLDGQEYVVENITLPIESMEEACALWKQVYDQYSGGHTIVDSCTYERFENNTWVVDYVCRPTTYQEDGYICGGVAWINAASGDVEKTAVIS